MTNMVQEKISKQFETAKLAAKQTFPTIAPSEGETELDRSGGSRDQISWSSSGSRDISGTANGVLDEKVQQLLEFLEEGKKDGAKSTSENLKDGDSQ